MSTVVAVVVMDPTIRMVTTMLVHPTGVDHNLHLMVSPTMLITTSPTVPGVQVVTALSTVTEVLEVVKV